MWKRHFVNRADSCRGDGYRGDTLFIEETVTKETFRVWRRHFICRGDGYIGDTLFIEETLDS